MSSVEDSSPFNGGGIVRPLLRAHPWSGSPLGEPREWPPWLRTIVGSMLDDSMAKCLALGSELRLIYNDAYLNILGDKHPAALGAPMQDVWTDIWPQISAAANAALQGRGSFYRDFPVTVRRGVTSEDRRFSCSYAPVRDEHSVVAGLMCTAIETTERVMAENQRAFQLDLSDMLCDLVDAADITLRACALLGERLAVERVGYLEVSDDGNTLTVKPDWTRGVLPSLAGQRLKLGDFGPEVARAVLGGEILVVDDTATDPRSCANAQAYAERGVAAFLAIPLMRARKLKALLHVHNAKPRQWTPHEISLAKDMVERTWAAAERAYAQFELRAQSDLNQSVFDGMTEGFALLDAHWTLLQINEVGAAIAQRPRRELVGRNHWEVFPELMGTAVESMYRLASSSGQAQTLENHYTYCNGAQAWIEIRAYPLKDGHLAIFFRDVSERKKSEDLLKDADRRKDEFLAMLAHELRNPLAPISSAAQLLQLGRLSEAEVRDTSGVIVRQVQHMTHLIDDLLDVSRVTRGLVALDKKIVDVRQVVKNALEQVTPLMLSRRHRLAVHLAPEPTHVLGDEGRLVQVVTNLLNNAAKYTAEGGNILVKTQVREDQVILQVQDDGVGMSPELVSRAFDLFEQAERTPDRSTGGLGLGLALVKSLVELHAGKVTCKSEGPGAGSTFTVSLPRASADAESAATRPAQNIDEGGPKVRLNVLIVDDNIDAAAMLGMLLKALGHTVHVEHNPQKALEQARAVKLDLCLLDIGLPLMDGNELARRLRADPATAGCTLVAITGYGQDSDREQTLAAGFNYHLVKPVNSQQLRVILAEVDRSLKR